MCIIKSVKLQMKWKGLFIFQLKMVMSNILKITLLGFSYILLVQTSSQSKVKAVEPAIDGFNKVI